MNAENKKSITIKLLKDEQNCISALADIWCNELGRIWLPDISKEEIMQEFEMHFNVDKLPITFVAFEDDVPVGMCSLYENDGIMPDLMPWIGDLVVSAEHQNKGIGRKLMHRTMQQAYQMGFNKLFLFVFEKDLLEYYQRLGWNVIGTDMFESNPVTVMSTEI